MSFKELLLAAILQWQPPWYPPGQNPETPEAYRARLGTIAEAIALEAPEAKGGRLDTRALAAATLTVWYGETRFSYEVHALGTSRWLQDVGEARCLGQLHRSGLVPEEEWQASVGSDLESTRRCARLTMRVLVAMSRYCSIDAATEQNMAKVFAAYGSGKGCALTTQAETRARRWGRVMRGI